MKTKRLIALILTLLLMASLNLTVAAAVESPADRQTVGRYLVTLDVSDITARGRIAALTQIQQGKVLHTYQNISALAVELPQAALAALTRDPAVKTIEPDAIATISASEDELAASWGVDHIDAEQTWSAETGAGVTGAGIDVAVIDTGIDKEHPDLAGAVVGGISFLNNGVTSTKYRDDNGHGTHVAGTIGARDNGTGVVGVAPQVRLYAVKVLDRTGSGYYSDIIAGIDWAISKKVDIINMSLGGPADLDSLKAVCDKAYNSGIVVVAAAGNDGGVLGEDTVGYPAHYESVIAVAATDNTDLRAYFSSTGPAVEISAPGVGIKSTIPGGGYATWSGTSMASPHVAGTVALLKAAHPADAASALRTRLAEMADDLGTAERDVLYGYGLVDAHMAGATSEPSQFSTSTTVSAGDGDFAVGEKVPIQVAVKKSTDLSSVSGAQVSVVISNSSAGYSKTITATTDANGQVTISFRTNKIPTGTYTVWAKTIGGFLDGIPYSGSEGCCEFVLK